jgi:hypothetical protein
MFCVLFCLYGTRCVNRPLIVLIIIIIIIIIVTMSGVLCAGAISVCV